ncbi:ribbon-helix-helix domain-containing protein [Candidatus Woesearchaeota archaeon]|nr:ribbon-helix-helix domain-containing protein [Candidatus Woesearchaeota archaeon]
MQTLSFKINNRLSKEIDEVIHNHRYSTRTEFIRDAIRKKLSDVEKQEIFRKLDAYKGSLKGKFRYTDEEAGELAMKKLAKRLGVELD